MTKQLSKTVLANRAARREKDANSRATKTLAAAFSKVYCADDADDFIVDSKGRRVRQSEATADDIYALLIGNRVVEQIEAYEQIGTKAFQNLIDNGCLRRSKTFSRNDINNLYWVTTKAREMYGLPARITLSTGLVGDYQPAE